MIKDMKPFLAQDALTYQAIPSPQSARGYVVKRSDGKRIETKGAISSPEDAVTWAKLQPDTSWY